MNIIFHDKHINESVINLNFFDDQKVNFKINSSSFNTVLKNSDFISFHIPKINDKALIGKKEFKIMKDGVCIVNTARGGIINEKELISELENEKVRSVGLDVFEHEPKPSIKILMNEKISLSPHIGGSTIESQNRIGLELAEQIINIYKNKLVKISEFQALIAVKEKLKNFSIRSYPEYSKNEIKNELKSNNISYLKILEEKKGSNDFLSIKQKIESFKNKKILLKQKASIYLYEQSDSNNSFIGFICGVSTKDYINGHIKKHENTLKKREILFEKYLEDCKVHAEPVLLTYNKDDNIENFIINKIKDKTDYEFTTNDEKNIEYGLLMKLRRLK